jgi:ribonuclease G
VKITMDTMKKILINENPWQTRIAIMRNDELQNIYFASHTTQTLERSYFKGKIIKVLPGIQTAFVDIGQEKAGFLHISEVDRELALQRMTSTDQLDDIEEDETPKVESLSRQELDISKILREGESILTQVSKEPVYEKGAKLTTCFTLPGRFLVLMPNIPRIGISKKIEEKEERQRLRDLLSKSLPEGMGAIIRTTSEHQGEAEIVQDLNYLVATWNKIQQNYQEALPGQKLHQDIDLALQIVRDHLDVDVEEVVCDNQETQTKIYKFVKNTASDHAYKVRYYQAAPPLFEKFGVERQIEQALHKKVPLHSGGSLIIETTESMTVIDVNTGRYIGQSNLEDTILKTNLEAAEAVVHQLRLRNIGGLIVIDFIDMSTGANRQKLFKFLEKMLKERDKFQSVVLKVSEFGLVQMTRRRSGKTLIQQMTQGCPSCHGSGVIKSLQTQAYTILRKLQEEIQSRNLRDSISVTMHETILHYISTVEYNSILNLERNYRCKMTLVGQGQGKIEDYWVQPLS